MGVYGTAKLNGSRSEKTAWASVSVPLSGSGNTEITRFNALKHGILSRYTVLPWEDEAEYQELLAELATEYEPRGPTEEHLVEELAGILWRKRRLRLAEAAAHHHGLLEATEPYQGAVRAALVHREHTQRADAIAGAIRATPDELAEELEDLTEDQAMTARALDLLRGKSADAYERAVSALHPDTRDWWEEVLERDADASNNDDAPATPDEEGLESFIKTALLPWYAKRRCELRNNSLIRAQAFGQSFDAEKMERLARYEVHLDRKLERILSMLIRLQDLRVGPAGD